MMVIGVSEVLHSAFEVLHSVVLCQLLQLFSVSGGWHGFSDLRVVLFAVQPCVQVSGASHGARLVPVVRVV